MFNSDSEDSERGIRFKTESVRQKPAMKFKANSSIERPITRRERHSSSSDDDFDKRRSRRHHGNQHSTHSRRHESKKKNTLNLVGSALSRQESSKSQELLRENIGPQLPPHLMKNEDETVTAISRKDRNVEHDNALFGPALPTCKPQELDVNIGPQLPPHLIQCLDKTEYVENKITSEDMKTDNKEMVGPALPPNLKKDQESNDEISSHLRKDLEVREDIGPSSQNYPNESSAQEDTKTIGPVLPPHLRKQLEEQSVEDQMEYEQSSSENEDAYGPLPAGVQQSAAQIALEERALQMKFNKLLPQNDEPTRESWMTELPDAKIADFGLGPRQFRKRAAPDMSDRSSWTTVAGEKIKPKEVKEDLKAEAEERELRRRDKEQEKMTKKQKRKSKSLVALHQEKLEKSEKEAGPSVRRPFSRETDLQVNKFDDAQRKAVLKKAQLLDDRFSSGKSKFL